MSEKNTTGLLFGGDWTEQKLAILAEYLAAYNTALKNQPFTRVYVDAFAGTGYRENRQKEFGVVDIFEETRQDEPQRFLKGSAKRALEVQPPFHRYVFVESEPENVRALESLRTCMRTLWLGRPRPSGLCGGCRRARIAHPRAGVPQGPNGFHTRS